MNEQFVVADGLNPVDAPAKRRAHASNGVILDVLLVGELHVLGGDFPPALVELDALPQLEPPGVAAFQRPLFRQFRNLLSVCGVHTDKGLVYWVKLYSGNLPDDAPDVRFLRERYDAHDDPFDLGLHHHDFRRGPGHHGGLGGWRHHCAAGLTGGLVWRGRLGRLLRRRRAGGGRCGCPARVGVTAARSEYP